MLIVNHLLNRMVTIREGNRNKPVVTVEDTLDGNYLYFDVVPSDIDHVELSFEVPSAPARIAIINFKLDGNYLPAGNFLDRAKFHFQFANYFQRIDVHFDHHLENMIFDSLEIDCNFHS